MRTVNEILATEGANVCGCDGCKKWRAILAYRIREDMQRVVADALDDAGEVPAADIVRRLPIPTEG